MDEQGDFLDEIVAEREAVSPGFRGKVALARVRRVLEDSMTPRGIDQWLAAPNRRLDGERPRDLLDKGETDRVIAAARSFVEGAYS